MALYYVAHRLFAAHDRALGAYIASRLARLAGADAVFLPFCDTDEENLVSDCKGRRLFELDCSRLRRITGMIAVLHGPSLDDGVCMEMGFAAALGIPIVIVSTDSQTYGPEPDRAGFAFAEPMLEQLAITVERVHRFAAGKPACDAQTGQGWTVWDVDDAAGTIDPKIGRKYDGPLPAALVEAGPIPTLQLRERLRDLGDLVVREGLDHQGAGAALLLRRPPEAGCPLLAGDETAGDDAGGRRAAA